MITIRQALTALDGLDLIAQHCYANSKAHGFWPVGIQRNKGEQIAFIHSELSEALKAAYNPNDDPQCPAFSSEEIEVADVLIQLLDYCVGHNLRFGEAVIAKMKFNETRPHLHSKTS